MESEGVMVEMAQFEPVDRFSTLLNVRYYVPPLKQDRAPKILTNFTFKMCKKQYYNEEQEIALVPSLVADYCEICRNFGYPTLV